MAEVLSQVREIAGRVATSEGCELVDVELHGRGPGAVLRIFLDKPGGITHQDCQAVSRQVGTILDVEGLMTARYTLEVSSPGLGRKLVKPADYERFAGQKVKFQLRNPEAGRRRLQGRLRGLREGKVRVEAESGESMEIAIEEIEKATLVPDFGTMFGRPPDSQKTQSR
ncbi:MAG: ribosome maturation factor RimP [Acidobacteria bacterium]|nr:ribosome maturation factor RimP [Acidobacteriota bacterium]